MRHAILPLLALFGIALLANAFRPGDQTAKLELQLQPARGVLGEPILLTVVFTNGTPDPLRFAPYKDTRGEVWQITLDGPDGSFTPVAMPGPFVPFRPDEVVELLPGARYEFTRDVSDFVRLQDGRRQNLKAGQYRANVRYQAPGGEERETLALWTEALAPATLDVVLVDNPQAQHASAASQLWCSIGITTGRPSDEGAKLGDARELRLTPEEVSEIFQRFQDAGAWELGSPGSSGHLSFTLILEGDQKLELSGGDPSDPRARAVYGLCEELLERLVKDGESK